MADIPSTAGNRPPATPRWVWMFGMIVIVLVVLFVVLHLTGRGFGGHTP